MAKIRPDSRPGEHSAHGRKQDLEVGGKGWPAFPLLTLQAALRLMPAFLLPSTFFPEGLCHSERPTGEPTGMALAPPPQHIQDSALLLDPGSETRSPAQAFKSEATDLLSTPKSSKFSVLPQNPHPPFLTMPWLLPFSSSLELFQLFPNWSPNLQPHHF